MCSRISIENNSHPCHFLVFPTHNITRRLIQKPILEHRYSSASSTHSASKTHGPPGRISETRERFASSLNGAETSRRSLKEALLSPIVPGERRDRYGSMDEGVMSLDDDIGLMESHSFDRPSLRNTRVSKEEKRRGTAFLNPAPVKLQWVGVFPDSPPGLSDDVVRDDVARDDVVRDGGVREDTKKSEGDVTFSSMKREQQQQQGRRASVARVLDEATTWRHFKRTNTTKRYYSPIRTRTFRRSSPLERMRTTTVSSSYVSSKTLDEELQETMRLLKIAKMGGNIEISKRDEEKYKLLKEHLRSPPPLSPFGYAVNSSASKRAYRAYMTASSTLRSVIRG